MSGKSGASEEEKKTVVYRFKVAVTDGFKSAMRQQYKGHSGWNEITEAARVRLNTEKSKYEESAKGRSESELETGLQAAIDAASNSVVEAATEAAKKIEERINAEKILRSAKARSLRPTAVPFQPKKQSLSSGFTLLSHKKPLQATAPEFKPKEQPLRISDEVQKKVDAFEAEMLERARRNVAAYETHLQGKFKQELSKKVFESGRNHLSIRTFAELYSGILHLEAEKFQAEENQRAAAAIEKFQSKAFEDAEANASSGLSPRRG